MHSVNNDSTRKKLRTKHSEWYYLTCIGGIITKCKREHKKCIYGFPSEETVKHIKEMYPEGCRIELVSMDDPFSKLAPGCRGTVRHVDDARTIFVNWDCGSRLGVVYGEDVIRILKQKKNGFTT